MPITFSEVSRSARQRAQQRSQQFADSIGQALPAFWRNRAVSAEQAQSADDKPAFLRYRKPQRGPYAHRRNKPLPVPGRERSGSTSFRPLVSESTRTPEVLANLAARRALRDDMVDAFGEGRALSAFAGLGVALKGEGKYAPLDEATQRRIRHYVPERAQQAEDIALAEMAHLCGADRPGSQPPEDFALFIEALRNALESHPAYGTAFFSQAEARALVLEVVEAVDLMKAGLMNEAAFEEYFQPIKGHDPANNTPLSFDQALLDFQACNSHFIRTSKADVAQLKAMFRAYCAGRTTFFRYEANCFLVTQFPKFSHDRLMAIDHRREQAYLSLSKMLPRELARSIAFAVWVICQLEVFPPPKSQAVHAD